MNYSITHRFLGLFFIITCIFGSPDLLFGQEALGVFEEKNGLLLIEMEEVALSDAWTKENKAANFTGSGYIYWSGAQHFSETGHGALHYPIYIHTPGTYRLVWRMMVGQGENVTDHNDNWLQIKGAQIYGQKPDGHRVLPHPQCTLTEGFDCPNGASHHGFFKVYGQDLDFTWQAHTSDHNGHDLFVDFHRAGAYEIVVHARSSHCLLDRLALFHIDQHDLAKATDISLEATKPNPVRQTKVSIKDQQFYINGRLTYEGRYFHQHKIEGLLFNARLVQGIFDDLNPESRAGFAYPDTKIWDPERNTDEFVRAMESWRQHGLLAFTLNLQGGSPLGYGNKNWVNSSFDPQGNLRPSYMARLERILDRADELGMVVLLGYFYFGQDQHLESEAAVIRAVDQITGWLLQKGYQNILVELNNECDIFYDHPILQAEGIDQLIKRVQSTTQDGRRLLVGTSYSGGHLPKPNVVAIADYLLLHGNSVADPNRIVEMVQETRAMPSYQQQPILFNEDDHYDFDKPANNLMSAVQTYASWGYFDFRKEGEEFAAGFQTVPVDWRINSARKISFFKKIKEITGH